jgi:hypothetical protein
MAEGEANAAVHSLALAGNDAATQVEDAAQEGHLGDDSVDGSASTGSSGYALPRVADAALKALHAGAHQAEEVIDEEEAAAQMKEGHAHESIHTMALAGDDAAVAAQDLAAGDDGVSPSAHPGPFATRVQELQTQAGQQ